MGEWMVPRSSGIKYFEKGLLLTKNIVRVLEVFEKTRGISKRAHSYFLYVGIPTRVTKFFRRLAEDMRCGEIQIGWNSFRKI